jgi:hypothetical protein
MWQPEEYLIPAPQSPISRVITTDLTLTFGKLFSPLGTAQDNLVAARGTEHSALRPMKPDRNFALGSP